MASEYLKWLARNERPEEPRVLTRKEKWKNWWYYHKWHVAIGVFLLLSLCGILRNALCQTRPDYQIAYVGASTLPDDTAAAVEARFASLGEDLNGDGSVTVQLVQYAFSGEADTGAAASAEVRLMADILECESYFFLLEDPEQFQLEYHTLCKLDGTLPDEADFSAKDTYLAWGDCPVLTQVDLGQYSYPLMGQTVTGSNDELLSRLFIARRGFWTEKTTPYPSGCEVLWKIITEGAVS